MPRDSFYDWSARSKWTSNVSNYHQSIGFDAGGSRYICVCGIVSEDGDSITIDNNNINHFEWSNEVNNLCLNGFAEIVDSTGKVGEVFSKYFCHLVFEIRKLTDGAKRTDGQFEDTSTSNAIFRHTFIINNFEIVRRTRQFVIYRLYLVGLEWYGLAQNVIFSNYDKALPKSDESGQFIENMTEWIPGNLKEVVQTTIKKNALVNNILGLAGKISSLTSRIQSGSRSISSLFGGKGSGDVPTEVFAMIKHFLGTAFVNSKVYEEGGNKPKIDSKSFETYASKINLHVCFGHNISILDAIKFLLNKLYYNEFSGSDIVHDDALKMIVYDEFQNSYGLIKYGYDSEFIKGNSDSLFVGTWESLFGSQFEALTEPVEQDLTSVVKKSTVDSLRSFFRKVYHYFTLGGFQKKLIESEQLIKYSHDDQSFKKDLKYQSYKAKMQKNQFDKYFPADLNYDDTGSQWSNDFTIYLDQVTNIIMKDALVLHTKGDITHRPGMKFGIIDDAVAQNDESQNSIESKSAKNASKEIIGAFNVVKVCHIVKPNSREKDNFTERLVLSRNFIADKK